MELTPLEAELQKARKAQREALSPAELERWLDDDATRRYRDALQPLTAADCEIGDVVTVHNARTGKTVTGPVVLTPEVAGRLTQLVIKRPDNGRAMPVIVGDDILVTRAADAHCTPDLEWEAGIGTGGEAPQQIVSGHERAAYVSSQWSIHGYTPQRLQDGNLRQASPTPTAKKTSALTAYQGDDAVFMVDRNSGDRRSKNMPREEALRLMATYTDATLRRLDLVSVATNRIVSWVIGRSEQQQRLVTA